MAATGDLSGGFADPPVEAAQAFRAAMRAMARPGTVERIEGALPPEPVSPAAGALLLTLCDADTPLHLAGAFDCAPVRDWVRFHCAAPFCAAEDCAFAVGLWSALVPLGRYRAGTPEYPDRSATLIVDHADFGAPNAALRGPGLAAPLQCALPDPVALAQNAARFPMGVDLFLARGNDITALPRSTRVEAL